MQVEAGQRKIHTRSPQQNSWPLMGKVNDDWSQEYNKAYYVLTADIQLNDVENYENWKETPPEYQWKPVGNSFKGKF